MLRGVAVGGLVAGVRVGKATGVVYLPGLGFMWFFSPGGVGHWAPNLHLRLTLLSEEKLKIGDTAPLKGKKKERDAWWLCRI